MTVGAVSLKKKSALRFVSTKDLANSAAVVPECKERPRGVPVTIASNEIVSNEIFGMARHTGISTSSVGRIWRAFGLQPHRVETFKLSTDPLFVDKVRDIVGLYLNPPDRALVLCVDEKSQIQ